MCEFAVCWSLKCVQFVAMVGGPKSEYLNSLGRIDSYMALFPVHHSLAIFSRMQKFNQGISGMLSANKDTQYALGASAYITGGFEAYKMPIIMFQLMFVLSKNDFFLPDANSVQWLKTVSNNKIIDRDHCNIFAVVISALQSCVDFCIVVYARA